MSSEDINPDLESFRQQWLSDLRSRDAHAPAPAPAPTRVPNSSTATLSSILPTRKHKPPNSLAKAQDDDDGDDYIPAQSFDGAPEQSGRTIAIDQPDSSERKQLVSALDHYEEAMEKEAQGNMGDSLHLYRRAYRMDQGVDKRYREKYFPAAHHKPKPQATKTALVEPLTSTPLIPKSTAESQIDPASQPLPIGELIASFSSLQIEPLAPDVEGTEPPPCPIASLPDELLIHILEDTAVSDVADLARLSLVCKRFAYLVSHEQRVWRRVCVRDEFGFPGMHHSWQRSIDWAPLEGDLIQVADAGQFNEELDASSTFISRDELNRRHHAEKLALTLSLVPSTFPSWRAMFQSRPRIRFNGCYISTVNYVRTGVLSTNQATWGGAPIHIVTYYRYLRFFRDGTCISLLTTTEPADVVHSLTRENLRLHRETAASSHLPSSVMKNGLRGRWRLSSTLVDEDNDNPHIPGAISEASEGNLYIETEGVGPKYVYRMDLSLRSAGKGARNNKLIWRGFYSYNKLTDDWGEFQLKNDKPFFFSRVKSYGLGD